MTEQQAKDLYDSKFWEPMSYRERAVFQLFEERLCMPFDIFHEAIEKAIGRPVWTHEFARNLPGLKAELMDGAPHPTMTDIIEMIPADKRIVVAI